jgi:hypothetical protein
LAKTAGVELPINAVRKEIGITAPIRFMIEPSLIIDTRVNAYLGKPSGGRLLGQLILMRKRA